MRVASEHRDNGKENGNYSFGLSRLILAGFRVQRVLSRGLGCRIFARFYLREELSNDLFKSTESQNLRKNMPDFPETVREMVVSLNKGTPI